MRHEIDCYFEPDITWLGEINRQMLRLERELSVFPSRQTHLNCALRPGGEKPAGVTLTLEIGDKRLRSFAEDPSPVQATRKAFDKLRRAVGEHLDERRREEFWTRTSQNSAGRQHVTIPQSKSEAARLIDRHLSDLYNFARREIGYRQAVGDLAHGELTPEEVVDEVALTAIEQFDVRPAALDFDRWLLQLALLVVERLVREAKAARELLHVEDGVQEVRPNEGPTPSGDEIFEFYQPDSDIRLEDLLEDERVPTPEEALASRELQQHINRTLATLPRRWREAFVLYSVEGLNLEEVTRVTNRSVDATRRDIEMAREYLRARLVDVGVVAKAAEGVALEEVKAS